MFLYSVILYLFYQSIVVVLFAFILSVVLLKNKTQDLLKKRKWEFTLEFKDGIISLSNSLNVGYSIENAFLEAIRDLSAIYPKDSYIIQEFQTIILRLKRNETIEDILKNLSERWNIEDVSSFVEVFITAKRTGGDIMKIIRSTSHNIGDKIEVKREIKTLISAKELEVKIMCTMPAAMIVYMWLFSPEFLKPMYHNVLGITIMTILLGIYAVAYSLANYMIQIEI